MCLIPVARLGLSAYQGNLGANPLEVITHTTGDWTLRFLLITLCITPLRRLTRQYWMIQYRRMVGLFAFFYGTLHLTTYLWFDKFFVWHDIVDDVVKRKFITVGFFAFVLMIPLAVTSTKGMIRRMGKRWKQLHRLAYPIGTLTLLHYYIQTKANVAEPVFVSGLFLWLMLWRALPMPRRAALTTLFVLVPASAVMTAAVEYAWYGLATRINPFHLLGANWSVAYFPRPAHLVAAAALTLALGVAGRRWLRQRPANPSRPLRASPS